MTGILPLQTIDIGPRCREVHGDARAIEEALAMLRKTLTVQLNRHPDGMWKLAVWRARDQSKTTEVGGG